MRCCKIHVDMTFIYVALFSLLQSPNKAVHHVGRPPQQLVDQGRDVIRRKHYSTRNKATLTGSGAIFCFMAKSTPRAWALRKSNVSWPPLDVQGQGAATTQNQAAFRSYVPNTNMPLIWKSRGKSVPNGPRGHKDCQWCSPG